MNNSELFKAGISFYILMAFAYASIIWISYWEVGYYLASEDIYNYASRLKSVVALYVTSPFWVGLAVMAGVKFRKLSIADLILSFIPFIAMCGLFASWKVPVA